MKEYIFLKKALTSNIRRKYSSIHLIILDLNLQSMKKNGKSDFRDIKTHT